jgi:hypothetical protein
MRAMISKKLLALAIGLTTLCSVAPAQTLNERKAAIAVQDKDRSPDALARRERSLAILKGENVPIAASLGPIVPEAKSKRRTGEEVAQRAIALLAVCVKASAPEDVAAGMLPKLKAGPFLSPQERVFVADPRPSDTVKSNLSWRAEALLVLMWALGAEDLPSPRAPLDEAGYRKLRDKAISLAEAGPSKATLRPQAEILDATDLAYRYHWAVVEARVNKTAPPAAVAPDVIMERHYALNWLIGYMGQAWDDITTDT